LCDLYVENLDHKLRTLFIKILSLLIQLSGRYFSYGRGKFEKETNNYAYERLLVGHLKLTKLALGKISIQDRYRKGSVKENIIIY
jgi:hypothetical protein